MNWLIPAAGLGGAGLGALGAWLGQRGLYDHGVHHRILPASPTTLIALLRAAAYGWQQDQLAANVEEIGMAGRELHDRLMTLTKHFAGVGRGLGRAVTEYNRTVSPITTRPRSLDDGSIPTQGAK